MPTVSSAIATEHGSRRIPAVSFDCQLLPCRRLLSCKMQKQDEGDDDDGDDDENDDCDDDDMLSYA